MLGNSRKIENILTTEKSLKHEHSKTQKLETREQSEKSIPPYAYSSQKTNPGNSSLFQRNGI